MRILSILLTSLLFVGSAFADSSPGMRIKDEHGNAVYVVNPAGILQWIPDQSTYDKLFRDWDGVVSMDVSRLSIGVPLSSGAMLAKGALPDVYLVSNGMKRPITEEAFNRYHFDWRQIQTVPQAIIATIPTGPLWN